FFFFQAEDGIRDRNVTGVQTCALPILVKYERLRLDEAIPEALNLYKEYLPAGGIEFWDMEVNETLNGTWTPDFIEGMLKYFERRSEERRVGKECRSRMAK